MDIEQAVREAVEEVGSVYYYSDVEKLVKLVEEKFKSTNKQSTPCPSCGSVDTQAVEYHCVNCNSWFCP
jgi:hypothetical protein